MKVSCQCLEYRGKKLSALYTREQTQSKIVCHLIYCTTNSLNFLIRFVRFS